MLGFLETDVPQEQMDKSENEWGKGLFEKCYVEPLDMLKIDTLKVKCQWTDLRTSWTHRGD